jgi:hypothetical protein
VVCIVNGGACDLLLSSKTKVLDLKPIKTGLFKNKKYGFYTCRVGKRDQKFFLYKMLSGRGQPGPDERKDMFNKFRKHL